MNATPARTLTRSQEDYLEAILLLVRRGRVARVRDIAKALQVGMPSVTAALRALSKRELVNYDPYQVITLTDAGKELAEEVSQRHQFLRTFLVEVLGLDAGAAEANACRMEHAVDAELLDRLRHLADFIRSCPRSGEDWIQACQQSCLAGQGAEAGQCRACLARTVKSYRSRGKAL